MFTKLRSLAGFSLLLGLFGCSTEDPEVDHDAIVIGLLLPFTGSSSATASNLERATLYAADRINAGGGIRGRNVRVISRDTHSDVERGVEEARTLVDEGAVAVIGPETAGIAEAIRPVLEAKGVVFLSPFVGAGQEPSKSCTEPWFRLAPSAKSIGEALATQADAHKVDRIAVMYSSSPYDQALGSAAAARFEKAYRKEVALQVELNPQAQSYAREISAAIEAGVTNVILATSPRAGALFVNEFDALSGKKPQWFLSPLLKTDLLVQNVAPAALEGSLGVAPKIYEKEGGFPEAFSMRWEGDRPLEGAYFYYDAMALLAVAMAKQANDDNLSLSNAVISASVASGESVKWDGIEDGLARLRKKQDRYYSGLTGPLNLQRCGSRLTGQTSDWTVDEQGSIVDVTTD